MLCCAAGDYQGKIIIWGLLTGERKSWVSYRSVVGHIPFCLAEAAALEQQNVGSRHEHTCYLEQQAAHKESPGVLCRTRFADGGNSWTAGSTCGSNCRGSKADLGLYSGCGASTPECSVERLLWIPAFSPQQRQAAAAAAAALTASAASLTVSSSAFAAGLATMPSGSAADRDSEGSSTLHSTRQHYAANLVVNASCGSLLSDASLANLASLHPQPQQQRQRQLDADYLQDSLAAGAAERSSSASQGPSDPEQLQQQQPQVLAGGGDEDEVIEPDALLLLASGGDGGVLLWHIDRLAQVMPLCTLPGK